MVSLRLWKAFFLLSVIKMLTFYVITLKLCCYTCTDQFMIVSLPQIVEFMRNYTLFLAATVFALSAAAANYTSVDLGLSVRWATCNVGASVPEGTGNRYAWGETATKSTYSWDNYRYGTAYNAMTKYCTNSNYGTVDNLTTLEAADDAAHQNWGDKWRTPTYAEWQELRTQCTWKWTDNYNSTNIKGYTVTATNGNTIFLPVTGFGYADQAQQTDEGYYWSSSLHATPSDAYYVQFSSTTITADNDNLRFYGQSVRPVEDVYTVILVAPQNGQLQSNKAQAAADETVTLSVISDSHYVLQKLSVKQGTTEIPTTAVQGMNAQYAFAMPMGEVSVTAEFQRIEPKFTPSPFSVNSEGKQVCFSPGNLQCAGLNTGDTVWSFAAYQTDWLGAAAIRDNAFADTIDLFCWSGSYTTAPWGIGTSQSSSDYEGDFVDWGQNTIGNYAPYTYRTPTLSEWQYLLQYRKNAEERIGVARIRLNTDGTQYVNGLILLPDDWHCPADVPFKTGFSEDNYSSVWGYAEYQTLALSDWQKLEAAGAVFLPAAGYRYGVNVESEQSSGYYWSASLRDVVYAYFMSFHAGKANVYFLYHSEAHAVRLVQDITYAVTLISGEHGTLLSDVERCAAGDSVKLTITPDTGYRLGELTVISANGKTIAVTEDYSFAMPAADVTVSVSFERQTATAAQSAEAQAFRVESGRIVCNGAFQIYDLLGRNMTHRNGQLNGVYIVRTGTTTQKETIPATEK